MKRIFYFAAVAALGVISCQRAENPVGDNAGKGLELKFSIENGETKTDLYGTYTINWSTGDKILVNCLSGFEEFTLKEGAGTRTGVFSIDKDVTLNNQGEYNQLCVYPETLNPAWYGVDGDHPTGGWYVILPDEYEWSATRSIKAPMRTYQVKQTQDIQDFTMCTGLLKVDISDIPANADKLVFTAPGLKVSGELYMNDGSAVISAVSGDSNHTITINFPKGGADPKTFLIPVPAATYSNFTIQFYDGADAIAKAGKRGTITVAANQLVYLPAFSCSSTPSETPETVLWEGTQNVGEWSWDGRVADLSNPSFWNGIKEGQVITVYGVENYNADTYRALLLKKANGEEFKTQPSWAWNGTTEPFEKSFTLTSDQVTEITSSGVMITGSRVTVTRVTLKNN